jgi:cytochrome c oxidase assembly protein subunit 15
MATAAIPVVTKHSRGAARFAWGVVWYNVLVILWGSLVRSTGSGDGCGNHWPLCNSQVIPVSPTFHTIIEFAHRQMVTALIFAVIAMIVWAFRVTPKGSAARVFAVWSMVLLLNEAFLGAMLVKLGYVTGNQSVGRVVFLGLHFTNTLLMTAMFTLTAVMLGTRQSWRELKASGLDRTVATAGIVASLALGVTGSMAALGDTLFPASSLQAAFAQDIAAGSPWLLRLRGVHPVSAFIAAGFVVWLVVRARRQGISPKWVLGLLAVQFGLGIADVILLAPIWLQTVHLLGADLFWVALVVLVARVVWPKESVTV